MLRTLFRYLANNEQLVQKLADSKPIRRAAQLVVAVIYRGKQKMTDMDPAQLNFFISFLKRFSDHVKTGIQDAKKQLKK